MPIQFLPPVNRQKGWGEILGTGLGEGINALVQHKVGEIKTQKQAKAWEDIGLAPEQASFIVNQPEWLQKELVSRLEGFGAPQQQQQQQAMGQQAGMGQPQQLQKPSLTFGKSPAQKKELFEQQKIINKEVHPFIKDVQHKAKGARENDIRLNRMEKLIETGKLNNPQFASLLKTVKHGVFGLGIDLTNLLSPESQEFEKLSGDFVKNAKDIFGSRITDTDLKSFLATIPNLSQSNEGKVAVIRNLKLMNKAAEIREQVARQLLKQYDNRPPLDFEAQVDEIAKPQLDAIAAEFEAGSSKKPKGTSTLVGDVVGSVGQSLLGVS